MRPPTGELPEDFEYLRDALLLCADQDLGNPAKRDDLVDSFNGTDIGVLALAHHEIVRKEDLAAISQWYYESPLPNRSGSFAGACFRLLLVMDYLYEQSKEPFSSQRLQLLSRNRKPNWDHLPEKLAFLKDPAIKYGKYQFDDERYDFVESMTAEQREELVAVRAALGKEESLYKLLDDWFDEYSITDHEEAALIYFMFGVLDAADL
ncbi:hypothetical protein NG895_28375 [Aeoliella sp. ICT_H6.2]|uniref:Uncharacterized protein n=1 Tax=Aeoliella straminimaris TaxID=2954799 RepID=A0A9X2FEY1_9BACT|nr:hypothetical protein [Aeoliella straminimaris]MCO6047840.1 hypothetical protein [Aeoliella straminimaris]